MLKEEENVNAAERNLAASQNENSKINIQNESNLVIKNQDGMVQSESERCLNCGKLFRITKGKCIYGKDKKCKYNLKG